MLLLIGKALNCGPFFGNMNILLRAYVQEKKKEEELEEYPSKERHDQYYDFLLKKNHKERQNKT